MELLTKTKKGLFSKIKDLFSKNILTDDIYEELEELLIESDISFDMTLAIIKKLEKTSSKDKEELYKNLKNIMKEYIVTNDNENYLKTHDKKVILIVGVNGVGKTTSIAKLSNLLKMQGKKVLVAAADTFRAAAVEQLDLWCQEIGVDIVKKENSTDPTSVVYDAISKMKNEEYDILIIDTAGRLHNKTNLMMELKKMYTVILNNYTNQDIETLLVVDANTGQNALEQAKVFDEISNLTGVILTKYDGTSRGGIVLSVTNLIKKPVRFLGIGEKVNDIKVFNNNEYIEEFFEN